MQTKIRSQVRSVLDIRPGEWTMATLMFLNLLLVISTFAVVKPARSSLFLQQFGASKLPYVYIATALLAGLVAVIQAKLYGRYSILRVQVLIYLFFISNLVFFWWALRLEAIWVSAAFFLWTNIFTVTLNTLFWILANNFYNSREAKRLYGVINSGGTIGGIASGFAVAGLVGSIGTENLLLVCAGILGICIFLVLLIRHQGRDRFSAQEYSYVEEAQKADAVEPDQEPAPSQGLFGSRYPKYIAAALGVALIVSNIIDFQFNVVVEQAYPLKDAKTAFFSSFFAWTNVLTFILQFVLTGTLLRRAGIGVTLLILPVTMLMGSAIFPIYPVLAAAMFLKISDSSLRYSIEQSTRDLLYLPIPSLVMKKLKSFVDIFIQRAAKGTGSILILILSSWLALEFEILSYVTLGLAMSWIVLAVLLRKEYLEELKRSLRRENIDEGPKMLRHLDPATTAELVKALESGDEEKALSSLELLEREQTVDLRLILREWVRVGSPRLQATALHRLAEVRDVGLTQEAEYLLREGSIETKEEAIHYLCAMHKGSLMEKMQDFLKMPDPRLRAAALACMTNSGGPQAQKMAREMLEQMVQRTGPQAIEGRILAARTLAHIRPPSTLHSLLIPLLQDESSEVLQVALNSAEQVPRRDLIPLIIMHLGNPEVFGAATQALTAHGDRILGTLRDYLSDRTIPLSIRCKLPGIFAEVGSVEGVRDLVANLHQEEAGLRYAVIKALNRLRTANPELKIREEKIRIAILREVGEAYDLLGELHPPAPQAEPGQGGHEVSLGQEQGRQYRQSVHRIFCLLGLLYTPGDILNSYRGLNTKRATEVRASSIEFLDNLLPSGLKKWILPLVDDSMPVEVKLKIGDSLVH